MARIVIEEPCVDRDRFGCCEDGWHRRVLDPGSFVDEVAHAVMSYSWTTDAMRDMESPIEGLDLAHLILDALAGGEQP